MKEQRYLPLCRQAATVSSWRITYLNCIFVWASVKIRKSAFLIDRFLVESQKNCGDVTVPGCKTLATVGDLFKSEPSSDQSVACDSLLAVADIWKDRLCVTAAATRVLGTNRPCTLTLIHSVIGSGWVSIFWESHAVFTFIRFMQSYGAACCEPIMMVKISQCVVGLRLILCLWKWVWLRILFKESWPEYSGEKLFIQHHLWPDCVKKQQCGTFERISWLKI